MYLTQADIETAFGAGELVDLADRDGDGVADAPVIDQAIGRATGLIDSYLRSRFDVPLTEVPDLVRECALRIVRYQLSEDHATDRVKDDYKEAVAWLGEIRDGKLDVGLTPAGEATTSSAGGPAFDGGRSAFNRDALDQYSGTSS